MFGFIKGLNCFCSRFSFSLFFLVLTPPILNNIGFIEIVLFDIYYYMK